MKSYIFAAVPAINGLGSPETAKAIHDTRLYRLILKRDFQNFYKDFYGSNIKEVMCLLSKLNILQSSVQKSANTHRLKEIKPNMSIISNTHTHIYTTQTQYINISNSNTHTHIKSKNIHSMYAKK